MSEMCSQDPVEESTPHYHCKTAYFTNTVFDRCPVISSVTSFEKLPEFISVSVFEDVLESPEQHNQPITPPVNVTHHVPLSDDKIHLTRADLKTHQKTCSNFLKNKTPNIEKMKEFVSDLLKLVEQIAAQYPTFFSIKPVYVSQPELKGRLTFGNLEDHQEKWKIIQQNSVVDEIKEHMSETIQKMELLVPQIEYYEKERETRRENIEIINKQKEDFENVKNSYHKK